MPSTTIHSPAISLPRAIRSCAAEKDIRATYMPKKSATSSSEVGPLGCRPPVGSLTRARGPRSVVPALIVHRPTRLVAGWQSESVSCSAGSSPRRIQEPGAISTTYLLRRASAASMIVSALIMYRIIEPCHAGPSRKLSSLRVWTFLGLMKWISTQHMRMDHSSIVLSSTRRPSLYD